MSDYTDEIKKVYLSLIGVTEDRVKDVFENLENAPSTTQGAVMQDLVTFNVELERLLRKIKSI